MKNAVNASIEFHYKGELYSASATIDLDQLMNNQTPLTSLHHILATTANIDSYSYQYEMLLAEDIHFSDAQGIAAAYLHDGHFDISGFEVAWREHKKLGILQSIAKRLLDVNDLEQQPALKSALLEAFQAGADTAGSERQ